MNRELCNDLSMFPTRNPLTNRIIKPFGPTHIKLATKCKKIRSRSRPRSRSRSRSRSRPRSRPRSRSRRSRSRSRSRIMPKARYHPTMMKKKQIVARYHPSMIEPPASFRDEDLKMHYMYNY